MILATNAIVSSGAQDIVVWIDGQSNSRGQGTPFPAQYQGSFPNIKIWNGSAFVTLNGSVSNNNQLGQPQGTFGAEMSMLVSLSQRYRTVYCVKFAVGGTSLATVADGGSANNWNAATVGSLFDTLITYSTAAIALLPSGCIIGGFFWFQGERDGDSVSTMFPLYYSNLSTFWSTFKSETGLSNIKIYVKQIYNAFDGGANTNTPKIRAAQVSFAHANYPNAFLLPQDAYPVEADYTHQTTTGYVDSGLGDAIAIATTPSDYIYLYTDEFSGTVITTSAWSVNGTGVSQNNKLIFTSSHGSNQSFATGRNVLSRFSVFQNLLVARVKMSWTDPTQTNESTGGLLMYKDLNNYVAIITDVTVAGGNAMKIRKRLSGVNTDTTCTAVNGDELKIVYNASTGAYTCYKYSAGAWISIGTGTGHTGQTLVNLSVGDNTTFTGGDVYTFEELDISVENYSSRRAPTSI